MIRSDIEGLTEQERATLDDSFERAAARRRARGVGMSALAVLVGLFLFFQLGFSQAWFAGLALTLLIVSGIEKISYQRTMKDYESLIRKLVHRIENLEGVPLTPDNARPTDSAKDEAKRGAHEAA